MSFIVSDGYNEILTALEFASSGLLVFVESIEID
jgi:hypothetical protein